MLSVISSFALFFLFLFEKQVLLTFLYINYIVLLDVYDKKIAGSEECSPNGYPL